MPKGVTGVLIFGVSPPNPECHRSRNASRLLSPFNGPISQKHQKKNVVPGYLPQVFPDSLALLRVYVYCSLLSLDISRGKRGEGAGG